MPGLLDEASALVEAWFDAAGCVIPDPAPSNIALVTSRMVARLFRLGDQEQPGVDSITDTAGPFSRTRSYSANSSQGGPWINRNDERLLATICRAGRAAFNVPMSR